MLSQAMLLVLLKTILFGKETAMNQFEVDRKVHIQDSAEFIGILYATLLSWNGKAICQIFSNFF